MQKIVDEFLTGERALFNKRDLYIERTIFDDGESPLKECADIFLLNSSFRWKYPLWYSKNIKMENCTFSHNARAGIWYTKNISVENCLIEGPKNFRRTENIEIKATNFTDAAETLWACKGVTLEKVMAKGDYFAMNTRDVNVDGLTLVGNYSFDGAENVVVKNSKLISKDAFWNSKNVTVYNSYIEGEYLGWNAENLTLIDCTIESLQGLCYVKNLTLKNCRLQNTTLAFEYSTVQAEVLGKVESVLNPIGKIKADEIGELILQSDKIDISKAEIVCENIHKKSVK